MPKSSSSTSCQRWRRTSEQQLRVTPLWTCSSSRWVVPGGALTRPPSPTPLSSGGGEDRVCGVRKGQVHEQGGQTAQPPSGYRHGNQQGRGGGVAGKEERFRGKETKSVSTQLISAKLMPVLPPCPPHSPPPPLSSNPDETVRAQIPFPACLQLFSSPIEVPDFYSSALGRKSLARK